MKSLHTFEQYQQESDNVPRFLSDGDYINVNNIEEHLKGEWAVFRITSGGKYYISSIYKRDLGSSIGMYEFNESRPKYSDISTLKLSKEFATKVALVNKRYAKTVGIVNDKGHQIII